MGQAIVILAMLLSLLGMPTTVANAATDVSLEASADTYMNSGNTKGNYNYGGATTVQANPYYKSGTDNDQFRGILMRWDLSSIPPSATVTAASISFQVTDSATAYAYNLYNLRRSWTEGSNNGTSGSGASWNYYGAGTGSWISAGAQSTTGDRYNTNLWEASTSTFSTTGSVTVPLNASGLAVVQGWISGSVSNYGLTIQNYSGTASDYLAFASRENTTYPGPTLNITYGSDPTILTSGTLSAFTTRPGVASDPQTYTVSGSNLTADITITAPGGFQISTDGSAYSSSVTLPQASGSVAVTTIYARLYSATEGSYSGDIIHASSGATTVNQAVSGTVSNTICTTASLEASEDTYLSASDVTYNNGGNTVIHVDATTGTSRRTALLRWNLSSIPVKATVSSASLSLYVTDASSLTFNLYNMRRSWVEGTSTQAVSSTSANWNTYDGASSWGAVGVASTTDDRYDTNLWSAGTSSFSSTGSKVETINSDGVAVVQGWINGSIGNYGLTMQNYSGSSSNAVYFASSENTSNPGATLNVSYCVTYGPTINVTGSLSAFSTIPGQPSATQSYTVSGSSLTDDINIIAPPNFEISTDGVFLSSLLLEQTGGVVEPTTIYVRLNSEVEGTFSGNITHTSTGADEIDLPVSGSALNVYTLTVTTDGNGSVTLNPPSGSYSNGTTVTLTPAPNSGYVFSSWSGPNNGDIVSTDGVYSIVVNGDKSIMANFAAATCSTVSLEAVDDAYMSEYNDTNNYGASTTLKTTNNSSGTQRGTLLRWDASSIPSNATVSSASVALYVSTSSSQTYNLYNMRRDWVEGTGASSVSEDGATWLTYDGANAWGTSGAASTTADRYNTNLWAAGATSFSSTGSRTVSLNSSGIAVVQGWVSGSTANYGLTMQNYSSTSGSDDLQFASSENTSNAGPTLSVTYCIAVTGPTIIATSSLDQFTSNIGVPSAEQAYTVSGMNLTSDIVITAPVNFEVSTTSGSGFGSTVTVPQSGGSVSSTTIYVRFQRSTAGTSSGNITHTSAGATQVNVHVSGTASNGAPAITLVEPADNATNVNTPPTLSVAVTDPDADTTSVSFYGRPVGSGTGDDFMIVLIPDPQNESQYAPAMITSQTQWVADNKIANNIVYVTSTGDMVNTSSDATQYGNADAAVDILDTAGVAYTMATGNHDIAYGSTLYANYFGRSRYADREVADGYWFGGGYDDYNTYSLFSAGGMDFILINLQYSPTTAVLNWADGLLTTYSDRRAIVEEHDILNVDNSWANQASYTALRDHDNLFLMLCGHMHSGSDGAAYVAGTGTGGAGQTIHVVQADYQDMSNGNGYLRLLRFSPANDMIYMTTYSPYANTSITTDPDQRNLPYEMASSGPYTLIGTVSAATGTNASISWTGLSNTTEYEWYAVVDDGTTSTTSSTWSFTTGTGAASYTLSYAAGAGGSLTGNLSQAVAYGQDGTPVTAVADAGYHFVSWSDGSTANPRTDTHVTGNISVTASFAQDEYTLIVEVIPAEGGTITIQPEQATYLSGATVNLEAVPSIGWTFVEWTGDISSSASVQSIVMDSNKHIVAHFAESEYTLNILTEGSGTVSAVPVPPYTYNEEVTLTAEAATGWHFVRWTGDLGGSDNPATLTLDGNKTVTATFLMDPVTCYALALTHTGHGADPVASPGSSGGCDAGQYVEGANINLSGAAPEAGWQIGGWSGTTDDSSVAGTNMVVMPAGAHTVSIIYTQREYSLTIHTTGSGSVTADPAGPYHYGDTVTLTAIPDAGWMFAGWDACAGTGTCTVTLSADTTITATFTLIEYTLTTSVIGNGSITLDNPGPYHLGDMVQLTATPASGWGFSAWGGDLSGSANPANITIDGNKTVSATFRDATAPDTIINTHPANPSSVDSATFTFTGTDNVTPSASLTFECELDSGAWASCTSPAPYSSLANGTHTFSVRAADAASNVDATPATFTWTVAVSNNQAPVANAGGPYTGYEGSSFNLSAAKSTDPDNNITLYQWDLDNDGQFDDATGKTARFTAVDNGTYTVRVQVTDADGLTSTASASVTVKNVAPKITSLAVSNWTRVKTPVYTQVKFSDPGANDTFTVTWTWGDGTSSSGVVGTNSATGSHTYTRAGIYFVTATVKDKDGGVAAKYTVIIVLPR